MYLVSYLGGPEFDSRSLCRLSSPRHFVLVPQSKARKLPGILSELNHRPAVQMSQAAYELGRYLFTERTVQVPDVLECQRAGRSASRQCREGQEFDN
jgi:hypothetical protein